MSMTRIKLVSKDYKDLERICDEIVDIAKRSGVKFSGPVTLPTKKMTIAVRKSSCGGGAETYDSHQMRLHKRLIDIQGDENVLSQVMRINVPNSVNFALEMKA